METRGRPRRRTPVVPPLPKPGTKPEKVWLKIREWAQAYNTSYRNAVFYYHKGAFPIGFYKMEHGRMYVRYDALPPVYAPKKMRQLCQEKRLKDYLKDESKKGYPDEVC